MYECRFLYWNVQLSDVWLSFSHWNVQLSDVWDMIFIFLLKFAASYRHFVLIKSFTWMQKFNRNRGHGARDGRPTCTIFGGTKRGPSVFHPHPVCLLRTPDAPPPWFPSVHFFFFFVISYHMICTLVLCQTDGAFLLFCFFFIII
jgi:hypothetical protein